MKHAGLAAVIIAGLASPAMAQPWVSPRAPAQNVEQTQVPVPSAPRGAVRRNYQSPPTESLFDGFYAGLALGTDVFAIRGEQRVPTTGGTGVFHYRRTDPGFAGDMFFGFGRLFGPGVYGGAEISAGYTVLRGTSTGQVAAGGSTYTVTVNQRLDAHFAADARIGYVFSPNLLAYGRLGWGAYHGTFAFSTDQNSGTQFDAERSGRWLQGPRFGAGFELAYFGNIRFRADYVFTYLFEHSGRGQRLNSPLLLNQLPVVTFIRPNAHVLRLAVVYGF